MVGFYKHDIPAWMDGTEALSDGAYRVYHVVIQLIMLNEGPIALNERGLAGRCNQTLKLFLRHLDELVRAGKLVVAGGRIENARAARELDSVRKNRENSGKGGKISGQRRNSAADLENEPANPLQSNDQIEASLQKDRSLKEKRREEKNPPKAPQGAEPEGFLEFRAAYPKRSTVFPTTEARKRWLRAIAQGAKPDEIIAGAKAYALEQQSLGKVGSEYVQTADVWLNKQRWKDYTATPLAGQEPSEGDYLSRLSDEQWRDHVSRWQATRGQWLLAQRTHPPDDRRTRVPPAILSEFGIRPGETGFGVPPMQGTG